MYTNEELGFQCENQGPITKCKRYVLCQLETSTLKFFSGSTVTYGESSDGVNDDTVIHLVDDKETDEQF